MSGTQELFDAIGSAGDMLLRDVPDFDVDEFARLLGPRIVQTSGKNYAFAMHKEDPTDCSDRTEYFDWHSDGLYHATPPRFVLLHCLDPGHGQVNTELADVKVVLAAMSPNSLRTLSKLHSHYVGHGGRFSHPILTGGGMLLASRGHVTAPDLYLDQTPSIREIVEALTGLYQRLDDDAVPYKWEKGGTLIFDQRKFMHRRNSAVIDRDRKLIRMWFN